MATSERQELIRNAVSFLSDFTTQQASLAQRVQFLEAKGLTGPEIEQAMKLAANQTSHTRAYSQNQNPSSFPVYAGMHPPPQQWDWRDYFITTVISGTVAYGFVSLFKKFMLPHLRPPTATAYEQDRDTLTAQFDAAETLLKEIQTEAAAVRAAVEEQKEKVDKATRDVESVVTEMREGEAKTRDEMREIRDEIENIREMLPKMMEKNKESQHQSLAELQQELKSLKALLLSRGSTSLTSSPSTPLPGLAGRPSIPSWQLAGTSPTPSASEPLPVTISRNRDSLTPPITANGTAKEVEDEFRQAVESFAQPQPRPSHESARPGSEQDYTQRRSTDSQRPSNQLAEGALRKSLAVQRTASPQPRSGSPSSSSSSKNNGDSGLRKTTLEERLRASFNTMDHSGRTANPSVRTSVPHAVSVTHHPLSPASIPLPESPTVSPNVVLDSPVMTSVSPSTASLLPQTNAPSAPSPVLECLDAHPVSSRPSSIISLPPDHAPDSPAMDQAVQPVHQPSSDDAVVRDEHVSVSTADTLVPDFEIQSGGAGVEALQERLRLVEQRFTDVSTSFKRLQAERQAFDTVIRELTPMEDTKDIAALRDYLANINMKSELSQDELQRLDGKLTRQEERIDELRDTHRLETASQSDQIEKLRQQLSEAEALVAASQVSASATEQETTKQDAEVERLCTEVAKAKEMAKEEEEKRVKAISLLKTVRQKLVKAEKDRDDALMDLHETRERVKQEKEKDKQEKIKMHSELDTVNLEREKAVTGLRVQFDKDLSLARTQAENEVAEARARFDAEVVAMKASYSTDLSSKERRISTLESSNKNLQSENKSLFEQSQLRQAELESSQCHAESLQSQNTELQFQLRELRERISLLNDELNDLRGEQEVHLQLPSGPTEDMSQLLSSVEMKYETRLSDLRRTLAAAEKERTEAEASWSQKLLEKSRETDELRRSLQLFAESREEKEDATSIMKAEIDNLEGEARSMQVQLLESRSCIERMKDVESTLRRRISEFTGQAEDARKQLEDSKAREAQLRAHSKTLRDELRKVQNSVAIVERQRNPGVGYWTSHPEPSESRTSISSSSDTAFPVASSGPSSRGSTNVDEQINLEYLRNVILQFLEHKEMRPNLVRVLSTILCFTPQETRRLITKV
ncbi:hypothetical protein F5I97DRAFT_1938352 [Phlebopus sp. FC_14]|nr:hypothetical protein F5I97DRAFT_1938352 [Phlebopus sp. FC_14]